MKRSVVFLSAVFLFAAMNFSVPIAQAQGSGQPQVPASQQTVVLPKTCCIAGEYIGFRKDTACTPFHKPTKEKFTAVITQKGGCGTFQAAVTGEEGKTMIIEGTVKPGGPKGCCLLEGKSVTGDDNIRLKATFCKKGGKWTGKGTYEDKQCKGTCEFQQL